jgi:hypothetical protein
MTVPSPRNPIRPARGNYTDLAGNISHLYDGEICYAIDQDQIYMNENGSLVPVGANLGLSTLSSLGDVDIAGVVDGEALVYNSGSWKNGGNMDGGSF